MLVFAFPVKRFVVQVIHNWLRDEAIFFVLLVVSIVAVDNDGI